MQRAEPSDRESVFFEVSIRCYCNESLGINAKPSACALQFPKKIVAQFVRDLGWVGVWCERVY